jgi:hypothetical protein
MPGRYPGDIREKLARPTLVQRIGILLVLHCNIGYKDC